MTVSAKKRIWHAGKSCYAAGLCGTGTVIKTVLGITRGLGGNRLNRLELY